MTTQKQTRYEDGLWSEAEIALLVDLTREWCKGFVKPSRPVYQRVMRHREVLRWAQEWGLLARVGEGARPRLEYATAQTRKWRFNPGHHLPAEAVWRLVRPMLRADGTCGFSITANEGWSDLNIYPRGTHHATERDLDEQWEVLARLSTRRYINLQGYGNLWEIRTLAEEEWRR